MSWTKKDQSIPMVLDEAPVAFFPACSKAQGLGSPKSQACNNCSPPLNRDMRALTKSISPNSPAPRLPGSDSGHWRLSLALRLAAVMA